MIKIFHKTIEIKSALRPFQKIGHIPTMGNLHNGHLSLIKAATKDALEVIVISIYVNPTQFEDTTDFNIYPRTLSEDIEKINNLFSDLKKSGEHKAINVFIFSPSSDEEMYPYGKDLIEAKGPVNVFEGALRPGHFNGVVTIVKKLFEIIRPSIAYFGKKDYQQCLIIQRLTENLFPQIEIKLIPTARDENGLALSSRNSRLSKRQQKEALILRQNMLKVVELIKSGIQIDNILASTKEIVAKDERFNYLALVNATTLNPPKSLNEKMILLGNFQVGEIKILDNFEF